LFQFIVFAYMGKPIPIPVRRHIIALRTQGMTQSAIAKTTNVTLRSVQQICQTWNKDGESSMELYKGCTGAAPSISASVRADAIAMKREHQGWGAEVVLIELRRRYQEQERSERLPTWRTLNTWFVSAKVNVPRKRCHLTTQKVKRGVAPHDVWAIDAKEGILLGDGSYSCTLNVTDEGTGAVLTQVHFPPTVLE
jgi:transposase